MKRTAMLALALALAGCGQPQANSPTEATASAPSTAPTPPKPTPEAWRAAFDSSFHMIGPSKDAGDGVTKFSTCFDAVEPAQIGQCKVGASTEKDGFRKLWIFMPRMSALMPLVADQPYVASYVSVRENKGPKILLSPHFIASDWLFITSLAVMVDGDVVLEQDFDHSAVKRHVGSGEVEESVDFVLSEAQMAAIRKIHPGSKVILRLTGKNGYVSLDNSRPKKLFNADIFASDIQEALAIHDAIAAKVQGKEVPDQP